jgi:hypothetical protein
MSDVITPTGMVPMQVSYRAMIRVPATEPGQPDQIHNDFGDAVINGLLLIQTQDDYQRMREILIDFVAKSLEMPRDRITITIFSFQRLEGSGVPSIVGVR